VLELPGTGTFLGSISGHSSDMSSIQFSPDGKTIATSADAQDNVKIRRITFPED
jgi:WD40 repeat protein